MCYHYVQATRLCVNDYILSRYYVIDLSLSIYITHDTHVHLSLSLSLYMNIYIYIYTHMLSCVIIFHTFNTQLAGGHKQDIARTVKLGQFDGNILESPRFQCSLNIIFLVRS